MSDRELMALAAKAAGARFSDYPDQTPNHWQAQRGDKVWHAWSPLTDDGDALRLAAGLGLVLNTHCMGVGAHTTPGQTPEAHATAPECDEANHMSSLRRCIVRAAAEIGRAMP
jgi:hypothetical protein